MNGLDPLISLNYMIAGCAVILLFLPAYVVSLALRRRTLNRDLQDQEELNTKQ